MLGSKYPHVSESPWNKCGFTGERFLPWWGSSKVIQSAPAEANQANQEAPRNLGCVQFVVSNLRHFLLLFLSFSLSVHWAGGWCCCYQQGRPPVLLGTWKALCHSFHGLPAIISGVQVQGRRTCGGNCISVCKAQFLFPLAVLKTRMSCSQDKNEITP